MKPRIVIPVPTTRDLPYNQRSSPQYTEAISRSGGEPVEVPLTMTGTALRELLATTHGVLLPGSPADVDPALYGETRFPVTAPADQPREAMDYALLDDALKRGKPVLGICYGVQSMNVWRGGTLVQDLAPLPVNHEAGSKVAIAHAALVAEPSLLASIIAAAAPDEAPLSNGYLRLPVNTSHHQAVGVPGNGLRVVARCPDDGVVEAVEASPEMFHVEHSAGSIPFFLGVQWHPERSYEISATSRALFARLVAAAVELNSE